MVAETALGSDGLLTHRIGLKGGMLTQSARAAAFPILILLRRRVAVRPLSALRDGSGRGLGASATIVRSSILGILACRAAVRLFLAELG